MTKDEARARILAEWDKWADKRMASNVDGTQGLLFFGHLQRDTPQLLNFRSSGDKWQVVHGWLLNAGRVSS